ncbi:MAG: hypothetical protein NC086_07855 [Alistipes sp.]|nr:hypothetical protein [Alistipes sp.]
MAFENEEDYLDNLLKSITSENNEDPDEDILEADTDIQMPETFADPQEEEDGDVFERLLMQQEDEMNFGEGTEEQSADDDDVNLMEALFGNDKAEVWEDNASGDAEEAEPEAENADDFLLDDVMPEEGTVIEPEYEELSEQEEVEEPFSEPEQIFEEEIMPEEENEEYPAFEEEVVPEEAENEEYTAFEEVMPEAENEEYPAFEEEVMPEENEEYQAFEEEAMPEEENEEYPAFEEEVMPEEENEEYPAFEEEVMPEENEEYPAFEEEVIPEENEGYPAFEEEVMPEAENEEYPAFGEETPSEAEDITVPEANSGEEDTALEDFAQLMGETEEDTDNDNDLIGQLDGLFNDVAVEMEEERQEMQEQTEPVQEESADGNDDTEAPAQEVDYSNIEVDDELKELLGVESAEQLADIPSEVEGLSEVEAAKLAEMEQAASSEAKSALDGGVGGESVGLSGGEEASDDLKEQGGTGKKKSGGIIAKILSIFKKKKSDDPENGGENENQKVLNELFDENGELLEDGKKVKKKGLFFKSKKKADVPEAEAAEDGEGMGDLGDIAVLDEEAPAEKKEKKKKEKKEKKPKKEKPEKPKKPKKEKKPKVKKEKPPVNPADLIHIKPIALIIMFVIIAGVVGYVYYFVTSFNYGNAMDRATYYMVDKRYTNAYRAISGVEMKSEEDIALKEQITTIMYVQHHYDAYERYRKVDLQFEALDALIQGIKTYDECYEYAVEQGVTGDYEIVKAKLVAALGQYGITESMARSYAAITNYSQYQYILEGYGGVSNDSGN